MFWPTFLQLMAKNEWLKLSCLPLVIQIVADNYGYFQQTEGGVYSAVSITITLHCVCVPVRGEILDSTHSRWPQLKSRSWEPLKCSEWRVTVLLSLPLSFTPRRKEPSSPALLITAPLTARRDDLKSMKAPYNNLKYQWTRYRNAPLAHTQSPTRRSVALKQTSRLLSFWPSPLSPGSKSPIWLPEAFHGYIYSICIYIYIDIYQSTSDERFSRNEKNLDSCWFVFGCARVRTHRHDAHDSHSSPLHKKLQIPTRTQRIAWLQVSTKSRFAWLNGGTSSLMASGQQRLFALNERHTSSDSTLTKKTTLIMAVPIVLIMAHGKL